jgi:hypothetical protein
VGQPILALAAFQAALFAARGLGFGRTEAIGRATHGQIATLAKMVKHPGRNRLHHRTDPGSVGQTLPSASPAGGRSLIPADVLHFLFDLDAEPVPDAPLEFLNHAA